MTIGLGFARDSWNSGARLLTIYMYARSIELKVKQFVSIKIQIDNRYIHVRFVD